MKRNFLLVLLILVFPAALMAQKTEKSEINSFLDAWHKAASEANFESYFSFLAKDAIYIGTDATENWDVAAFKKFAKPFFDRGKTWHFTAVQRNIYFAPSKEMVWFDELLNTQMKLCRGSGVLIKEKGQWKIKHYVLSMTIPNDDVDAVVTIKTPKEDILLQELQSKK
ncbi:nuclear transport factor 2 family protein [Flavobacterium agrisoli]|uniref:Nuclear transport factor 2 family protein n=1 Tax=Flavobacterium agrisoli TaxID=2793066 RepID=A0A934PQL2_9FLAO|nr:nuclear transport factor 2 family protein [Flavobacterium agrisoli]MBK0371104.1 nuclear transport factor 2 family protein [Flavobacterium agrisoli]